MVDYNQIQTISTPPQDILRLQILERRFYAINAIQEYNKITTRGGSEDAIHVIRAAMYSLFLEIEGALRKDLDAKAFQDLNQKCVSTDIQTLTAAFSEMNNFLYRKQITKFDNRNNVDHLLIEESNNAKNL